MHKQKEMRLKRGYGDNVKVKLDEIAIKYKDAILNWASDVFNKDMHNVTDDEIYNLAIDAIYVCAKADSASNLIETFNTLSEEQIKNALAENGYVRENLNKILGMKKDYIAVSRIGDNGICNSVDFTLADVDILLKGGITKDEFRQISDKYINDILKVIKRNRNLNVYFIYDPQVETDEEVIQNFNGLLNGETELNFENKIIFLEFMNLLRTYTIQDLLQESEFIKKELNSGLYDYIKGEKPEINDIQREKLHSVIDKWNKQDFANYNNLELLLKRFKYILENLRLNEEEMLEIKSIMLEIQTKLGQLNISEELSKDMDRWYKYFEKINREDLVKSVYSPNTSRNIDVKKDVPETMLLHFYNPEEIMLTNILKIVAINRMRAKNGEEPIEIVFPRSEEEEKVFTEKIESEMLRFNDYMKEIDIEKSLDELEPGKPFKFENGDMDFYRKEVLVTAQNQYPCYLINKESLTSFFEHEENLLTGNGKLGFAVGLSAKTVMPENIILSCDENANSNIGIENIPCKDLFVELSKTSKELNNVLYRRTEVLVKRDGISADYLLALKGEELNEYEKALLEQEIRKAEKLGIKVIFIDIEEITKKENEIENVSL